MCAKLYMMIVLFPLCNLLVGHAPCIYLPLCITLGCAPCIVYISLCDMMGDAARIVYPSLRDLDSLIACIVFIIAVFDRHVSNKAHLHQLITPSFVISNPRCSIG